MWKKRWAGNYSKYLVFKIGFPDWTCKWKMHCPEHLCILKGVKLSDLPLCSSSSANYTQDSLDTNHRTDTLTVHREAPAQADGLQEV